MNQKIFRVRVRVRVWLYLALFYGDLKVGLQLQGTQGKLYCRYYRVTGYT